MTANETLDGEFLMEEETALVRADALASLGPEPLAPRAIDEHFARLMERLDGGVVPELGVVARIVSAALAGGHSCVSLSAISDRPTQLAERLSKSKMIASSAAAPLVLDAYGRIFLQRYWCYEQELAAAVAARVSATALPVDEKVLQAELATMPGPEAAGQRAAVVCAMRRRFCVITGGPGTGKTRTVARIIALLRAEAKAGGKPLRVALAAPTGKAAARMVESVRAAEKERGIEVSERVDATTLHALLGLTPGATEPRYHAGNPLPSTAVIVDEASMIDLSQMTKLLAAVSPDARLILLGDKDQLASVDTGRVLGDLCNDPGGSSGIALRGCIVELTHSFRFGNMPGISAFSEAVRKGRADDAIKILSKGHTDLVWRKFDSESPVSGEALVKEAIDVARRACVESSPEDALVTLGCSRILCAVKNGAFGTRAMNRLVENAMGGSGAMATQGSDFHGRAIMILRNDYALRLMNGDVGLFLATEGREHLRAYFPDPVHGGLRAIIPSRLPEHESVWAMTIHKSQGSEFQKVQIVLPLQDTQLLTRELIYTAITRARGQVELCCSEATLKKAIERDIKRESGLHDALWSK